MRSITSALSAECSAYKFPLLTKTGVHYIGPFYVTVRRTTENRRGFLFTCLTTSAVHVEIDPSVDYSSCVMRVERFLSCRGTLSKTWSDNATTFVGAEKALRISKSGIPTILLVNLPTKALTGDSIRPVRHTKVSSGRCLFAASSAYFTASLERGAS